MDTQEEQIEMKEIGQKLQELLHLLHKTTGHNNQNAIKFCQQQGLTAPLLNTNSHNKTMVCFFKKKKWCEICILHVVLQLSKYD